MADDYDILRVPFKKPEWDAPARSRWTFVVLGVVGFWAGIHSFYASRPWWGVIQAGLGVPSVVTYIVLMAQESVTGRLIFLGWGVQVVLFLIALWTVADLIMTTNDGRGRPLEWKIRR